CGMVAETRPSTEPAYATAQLCPNGARPAAHAADRPDRGLSGKPADARASAPASAGSGQGRIRAAGPVRADAGAGAADLQSRHLRGDGGRIALARDVSGLERVLQSQEAVELGYVHHERCEMDRRSVRVRLTPAGQEV